MLLTTVQTVVVSDGLSAGRLEVKCASGTARCRSAVRGQRSMVRRITRNTLLKGMPGRGWRESKKHHDRSFRIDLNRQLQNPQH